MQKAIDDLRLKAIREAGKKFLPDGYWQNCQPEQKIAPIHLTFDDGPLPETTPYLVSLLAEKNVQATFFFTGENARKYPELVRMTIEHGHQVGNHSYSHKFCYLESKEKFKQGIELTNKVIKESCGITPQVYRPPFGIIDGTRANLIKASKMKLVYWGALAEDWKDLGSQEVVRRISKQIEAGTIIVLHEIIGTDKQCLIATAEIVDQAIRKGYHFDSIGETNCSTSDHRKTPN